MAHAAGNWLHQRLNGHAPGTSWGQTLVAGAGGALALNAVHELGRRVRSDAPRMDVIGMRALARLLRRTPLRARSPRQLRRLTLIGDLIANSLFYALTLGRRTAHPWLRAGTAGALAGVAGAVLPPRIGLGRSPGARRPTTPALTIGWYLAGGLVTAALFRVLSARRA